MARPTAAERMGHTIRALRHRRELTLVQLAERTELSHSFLSQLERGRAQPSMGSLHRIAQALGTSQDQLIAGGGAEGNEEIALLRREEGVAIPMSDRGSTGVARQLPAGPGGFYPTEFAGLGREFGEFFKHEGSEFLYVAEGTIEVELGERTYRLRLGDSLRYPGHLPHRWRADGAGHSRVLMVHIGLGSHPVR